MVKIIKRTELFTDYVTCRFGKVYTDDLEYPEPIKGTYDYYAIKIIEAGTNVNNEAYSMDNLLEYEIY